VSTIAGISKYLCVQTGIEKDALFKQTLPFLGIIMGSVK
jgi:hypothetical protein